MNEFTKWYEAKRWLILKHNSFFFLPPGGASIGALDFGNVMNVFGGDDNSNGGGNNNAAPYEEVVKRQPAYTAPQPTYTYQQQPAAYTATTQPAYKAAPTTGTSTLSS